MTDIQIKEELEFLDKFQDNTKLKSPTGKVVRVCRIKYYCEDEIWCVISDRIYPLCSYNDDITKYSVLGDANDQNI